MKWNEVLTTERYVVEIDWRLDSLYFSTDIKFLYSAAKVRHRRVRRVVGAKNVNGLFDFVWAIYIID